MCIAPFLVGFRAGRRHALPVNNIGRGEAMGGLQDPKPFYNPGSASSPMATCKECSLRNSSARMTSVQEIVLLLVQIPHSNLICPLLIAQQIPTVVGVVSQ